MRRLYHAFFHSLAGIRHAARHETSFREELIVFLAALPAAFWLSDGPLTFVLLVGVVALVMIVELLNTAIEAVCNGLSRDYMEEIKVAKDCGSAAVLFASLLAGAVWLAVLYLRIAG